VSAVNGCSTDATAVDEDPKPSKGRCGRLTDDVAGEFESPESTEVLAVFADWLGVGSSLSSP
jgi:hypothetical protein